MTATADRARALSRQVAFLSAPAAYPAEAPPSVEVRETHASWVFLTPTRAYKLKKPLQRGELDLSSLPARQRNAVEELRLNRRLAAEVYLEVLALAEDARGRLSLGGPGAPVDWLVVMRRLPAARMLDRLIAADAVTEPDLARLGQLLSRFWRTAPTAPLTPQEHLQGLLRGLAQDQALLARPALGAGPARIARVTGPLRALLERRPELLLARARAGRVVDGHGDLRPEHICLLPQPVVIDCLEFSARLRQLDPADELAFLRLECERLGAPEVGDRLLELYREISGDRVHAAVACFYRAYRALRRARLALQRLEEQPSDPAALRARGAAYLELADTAVAELAAQDALR